jgi:hypothetical protein
MSIEQTLDNLAKALVGYTDAINVQTQVLKDINANGVQITRNDAGAATPAATEGKKPTKAEIKAAAEAAAAAAKAAAEAEAGGDDGDDWGDSPATPAKALTAEDVRDAILKVRDKGGEKKNVDEAKSIMAKLGVKTPSEIKPEQYEKAVKLCDAALA